MTTKQKTSKFQHPDYRQQALDLIEFASHKAHIITFPTAFLTLLDYQQDAAILLNQILYWSSRTSNPDGWFYKTYDEWHSEIGLSRYKVQRALDGDSRSSVDRLTLREIGVETMVRKAPNGNPTVHYRIDMPVFLAHLEAHLSDKDEINRIPTVLEESLPFCNNVEEGNATESHIEMQQCDTSSSYTENKSKEYQSENLHTPERDFSFFHSYEKTFGKIEKLSANAKNSLIAEFERLGSATTKSVIERCIDYGNSWHYVITALKNESSAENFENSAKIPFADDTSITSPDDEIESIDNDYIDDEDKECSFTAFLRERERLNAIVIEPTERTTMRWEKGMGEDSLYRVCDLWSAGANQLKWQLGDRFASTCLNYLTLVDFEPSTFTFAFVAENDYAAMQVIRFQRQFRQVMNVVIGGNPTFVTYTKDEWANGSGYHVTHHAS